MGKCLGGKMFGWEIYYGWENVWVGKFNGKGGNSPGGKMSGWENSVYHNYIYIDIFQANDLL